MLKTRTLGKMLFSIGFITIVFSATVLTWEPALTPTVFDPDEPQPEPFRIGGNTPFIIGIAMVIAGLVLASCQNTDILVSKKGMKPSKG